MIAAAIRAWGRKIDAASHPNPVPNAPLRARIFPFPLAESGARRRPFWPRAERDRAGLLRPIAADVCGQEIREPVRSAVSARHRVIDFPSPASAEDRVVLPCDAAVADVAPPVGAVEHASENISDKCAWHLVILRGRA